MRPATRKETRKEQVGGSRLFLASMLTVVFFVAAHATCFASSIVLQWDADTDPTTTGYKVYYQADSSTQPFQGTGAAQGAAPVDTQNLTTATITGLDPAHAYYFAVTAYNASGIESSYSNIATVPELTPPTVSLSSPTTNTTVSGTVSVNASASDNVGVTKVEFYVNGVLQATDTATPYVYSWNTSGLASGSYTLQAKAYDAAGNVGQSSIVSVTVAASDTTPPTVSVTSPANNAVVSGTVTIAATASDNVGVSRVEFYENGVLLFAGNTAPYSYSWNTTSVANGSYTLSTKAYDASGNIGQSANVSVTVNNIVADTTAPTVSAFTMPATATSLTVAISSFTASDNVGVTGYLVSESATAPSASATGWTSSAPASFTFSGAGSKTAYAWAKDAAGNVSAAKNSSVTITLADTTAPTVSAFTLPSTATSLTVAISSLTASDNVGVTGYLVTESATAPSASATGWTSSAPASFTFSGAGSKTAYAWARDAAGNVSSSQSAQVTITLADTTAPTVSAFTLPSTATSLTVAISSFTASDNVGVTGYLVSESATAPSASATGWTSAVPTSFTFSGAGSKTAYAWAKDAAGNVSAAKSSSVTITLADTTAPTVSAFTMPATATSLTVAISSFTASDNVGVTGYLVSESATAPSASATGWTSSAPASFTFSGAGSKTAYAWAKDAAGNVSSSQSAQVTITIPATTATPLTISDALTALNVAAGTITPTAEQISRLDVAPVISGKSAPDGKIDVSDAIVILSKIVGKIAL